MSPNPTLKESIEKAENDQNTENEKSEKNNANSEMDEKSGERSKTGKVDEKNSGNDDDKTIKNTPEREPETGYIPDPEIENAVKFYSAINDPEKQIPLIRELALRAGILSDQKDKLSKTEEKTLVDLVNETLGEEYGDLRDRLAPIVKAIEKKHGDEIKQLREEILDKEREQAKNQFSNEFDSFLVDNKIDESQAAQMLEIIEQMPPNPNAKVKITLKSYLTKVHKLISADNNEVKKSVERINKIEENRLESAKTLSSDISEDRIKKGSRNPSIREAIEAAQRGERFDE